MKQLTLEDSIVSKPPSRCKVDLTMSKYETVVEMMGDLLRFYRDEVKFTRRDINEYFEDEPKQYIEDCINQLIAYDLMGFIPFTRRTIYFIPFKVKKLVDYYCSKYNNSSTELIFNLIPLLNPNDINQHR